jgi:hypothetical protein
MCVYEGFFETQEFHGKQKKETFFSKGGLK